MNLQTYSKIIIASILMSFYCGKSFGQSASLNINTDPKINQLLELKKDLEKENKLSDGYTIQLYYGNWPASIEYETPNYKVWAGNFASRIEAERALLEIQKSFSSAFILKPERRK